MESKIITKITKGDTHAFEMLVREYEKMAYKIAYRYVGNEEDAKDVTQEAFIKIYGAICDFNGQAKFSTWLYRIVSNTALDFLRKRRETFSIDETVATKEGEMVREIEDKAKSQQPEEALLQKEAEEKLQASLMKLSLDHREVILLRAYGALSYEEIGAHLNLPSGTVKSRLKRGREELKKFYFAQNL